MSRVWSSIYTLTGPLPEMQNAGATQTKLDVASKARPEAGHKFKNFILQKGSPVDQGQLRGSCFPQPPPAALPA